MNKRITIKDIAKAIGVHHSTVSRALADDPRVKPTTKLKIKAYADKHGYIPNVNALSFRDGSRNIIALIVPNVKHSFFSNIISDITNYANNEGYIVAVFQSNENLKEEAEIVTNIIRNRFAGVIASLSMETTNMDHFSLLKNYNIPLVLFDRVISSFPVSKVVTDSTNGVQKATQLLLDRGYPRITYLGGSNQIELYRDRRKGYTEATENLYQNYVEVKDDLSIDTGRYYLNQIMEAEVKPNAIICDSYHMAMGVYDAIKEHGWNIPKDLALLSFGSEDSSRILTPPMSLIRQPEKKYAMEAFSILLRHIKNEEESIKKVVLPLEILLRDSC